MTKLRLQNTDTVYPCNPTPGAQIQRKTWSKKRHAPQHSLQHCLEQSRRGSNRNVRRQRTSIDKEDAAHTYNEVLLRHKKIERMPFAATWMDLESVNWVKSVSQRRRNILWHPLWVESKKKWYKWTYETDSQTLRMSLWLLVWGTMEGAGIVREFGMGMYTLLYFKCITRIP